MPRLYQEPRRQVISLFDTVVLEPSCHADLFQKIGPEHLTNVPCDGGQHGRPLKISAIAFEYMAGVREALKLVTAVFFVGDRPALLPFVVSGPAWGIGQGLLKEHTSTFQLSPVTVKVGERYGVRVRSAARETVTLRVYLQGFEIWSEG